MSNTGLGYVQGPSYYTDADSDRLVAEHNKMRAYPNNQYVFTRNFDVSIPEWGMPKKRPLRKEELTGRRRYRVQGLNGVNVLILQVEVSKFIIGTDDRPGKWECSWRDATAKDVTEEVV